MRSLVLCLVVLLLPACSREPICSAAIDRTGRGVPLYDTTTEGVVCDDPGGTAHYERDPSGRLVLREGTLATCDESNQPVCADRTVAPRCAQQPPSEL
jgi:hypothetical protein